MIARTAAGLMLVAVLLSACATRGQIYDRAASDAFEMGVTRVEDAVAALGSPDLDLLRPDGNRILRWRYQTLRGVAVEEHVLSAKFGPDGRLIYLHNPKKGQEVSLF